MTNLKAVSFDSLLGPHVLTGCDECSEHPLFPYANSLAFKLDGVALFAIEDPDDGYRSALSDILVCPDATISNTFAACDVMGRYGKEDTLIELVDRITGKVVITIGTDNSDYYYPSFIGSFDPTAMAVNNS